MSRRCHRRARPSAKDPNYVIRTVAFVARCSGAATLAYLSATWVGLPNSVWAAMSALIVSQEQLSETRSSLAARIFGTLIGTSAAIALVTESDTGLRERLLKLLAIGLISRRLRLWAAHPRPRPTASPASANNRLCQHAREAPLQGWSTSNRCCPRSGHTEPLRRMVGWLINGEAGTTQPDGAPPTVTGESSPLSDRR
jgi:hypothetical protein